ELPPGFAEQYTRESAAKDGPDGFLTKDRYVGLFKQSREATLTALANLPEADLERPIKGEVAKLAPTIGALFLLMASHTVMHAGQLRVVGRKLGKPVLF